MEESPRVVCYLTQCISTTCSLLYAHAKWYFENIICGNQTFSALAIAESMKSTTAGATVSMNEDVDNIPPVVNIGHSLT